LANLRDIVRELIKDNEEIYSMVCKVVAVDETLRTCDVEPIDGSAAIFDVRLQSKNETGVGLVAFPSVDSDVTVTFISKELAFVSCTNQIDRVQLNIGEMSLMMDAENFEKSVKNIKINTEDHQETAKDIKISTETYDLSGESATFTLSSIFSIDAQDVEVVATNILMDAAVVEISGATTINGITEVNGATTINGLTTINGGATISGAVAMAASLTIAGGTNGGMPIGSKIKDEFNKIVTEINNIKSAFEGWTPVFQDGGAALKVRSALFSGSPLSAVNTSAISNDNVKH